MVQGNATVHSDPAEILHYSREAAKLRGVPEHDLPTEPRTGRRLHQGVTSSHSLLGLLGGRLTACAPTQEPHAYRL